MDEKAEEIVNKVWDDYFEIEDSEVKLALLQSFDAQMISDGIFTKIEYRMFLLDYLKGVLECP